jgi:hypothetical protein
MRSDLSVAVGKTSNIITTLDLDAILRGDIIPINRIGAILYALMMEPIFFHREETGAVTVALRPLRTMSFDDVQAWMTRFGYLSGSIEWASAISEEEFTASWRVPQDIKNRGKLVALEGDYLDPSNGYVDYLQYTREGLFAQERGILPNLSTKDFVIASRGKEHVIYL